jgi:hypothetical protein
MKWVAVTVAGGPEDIEAYGPFSSKDSAEKFVADYEDAGVRPAYPLEIVELYGVRAGRKDINDTRAMDRLQDS